MLKRKAYADLEKWYNGERNTALVVLGARQVGKTTLLREFCRKQCACFIEMNFLTDMNACRIFSGSLQPTHLYEQLTAYTKTSIQPGKTLLFLDEIQACPNARTAIKFLVEDGRLAIVASGARLGIVDVNIRSYSVGFESFVHMYPMDFEEFLWANSMPDEVIQHVKECFIEHHEVPSVIHDTFLKLFQTYIVVGGMPASVKKYIDSHDIADVIRIQKSILEMYRMDISQYTTGIEKIKIQEIFDNIQNQLNEKNRRFTITALGKHMRMRRCENSFAWIIDAGVALTCYNVTLPQIPLMLNKKHSLFKLFMVDTGLLCASCMENVHFEILNGNLEINLGSIIENYIAQEFQSSGFKLYYYNSNKHGEVDFVVQNGRYIDLVEVKSGRDYYNFKALSNVLSVKEWKFGNAYVFCRGNVQEKDGILFLPLYMAMFLKPAGIDEPTIVPPPDLSVLNQWKS